MKIELTAIATVYNHRKEIADDNWGEVESEIRLLASIPAEALTGIDDFSHLQIIFYFDQVKDEKAIPQFRHPRGNTALPKLGTYAQRNKNRPNKLGLTTVELIRLESRSIFVKKLDAIDGTPVLDIKPVMKEFLPTQDVKQPDWTKEIMKNYW